MPSLKWVFHKGKKILFADMASQNTEELLDIVARLQVEIEKEPLGSIRAICDSTGGKINSEINHALKEFMEYIDPYIKMIVVIGMVGFQKVLFNGIIVLTGTKKLAAKNSKEEALDFLAGL